MIPMRRPTVKTQARVMSRRTLLRGAGVTMALPWLESLSGFGTTPAVGGGAEEAIRATCPKRFAVVFMGTGVSPAHWTAEGRGESMQLGRSLAPLAPFRERLNVIGGLYNRHSTGIGIHPAQTGGLLSGAAIRKGSIMRGGISMDQVIAGQIGQETLQPSLVLACEQPMTGYHESNFSNAYSSHISWHNETSPVPNELYPSLAFDSLFENSGSLRNLSVLDRVREQASELRPRIGSGDRAKLDEYFTAVREVERSIERLRDAKDTADRRGRDRGVPTLAMKRPDNGLPEDLRDHGRLMCDLIALAFQMDKTRVASLILARDLSSLVYPFLDVADAHHAASHHDTSDDYEKIVRFHVGQVAYLAGKLAALPEGEGTVLDHSCLMFLSNMFSGTKHDNSHLPIVTIGGLGGALETGRVLRYRDAGDDQRKVCSLYLGIMDRMGVRLDSFGDADTRLAGF